MYFITYKNLPTGNYHTVFDDYEGGYNLSMFVLSTMEKSGIIKIERYGKLEEIDNKEE